MMKESTKLSNAQTASAEGLSAALEGLVLFSGVGRTAGVGKTLWGKGERKEGNEERRKGLTC